MVSFWDIFLCQMWSIDDKTNMVQYIVLVGKKALNKLFAVCNFYLSIPSISLYKGGGLCIFWAFWRIHTEAYDWNDCWCCSEFFTHGNQHWWYEEKFSLQSTFSLFCSFCWYARSTPESGPSVKHALVVLEWFYMVAKKYYFCEEFFFGPQVSLCT